jgi:hypothetical protein
MRFLELSRQFKMKAQAPSTVVRSGTRMMPPSTQIKGTTFRTASGKKLPMFAGIPYAPPRIIKKPGGPKDFHGAAAFPSFGLLPYISAGAQMRLATSVDRFGKKSQLVDIKALRAPLNRLLAITGIPYIGARFVVWHVGRWAMMEMVWKTPVETGRAAGAWTISPQLRSVGKGYGRVGFRITNPVGYVIYLEHGHSEKAPQGMSRVTMLQARTELLNLMDELIAFWQQQQFRLRGFKWDEQQGAGVPMDPAEIERRLPSLTWRELMGRLKVRLPLDKPVAQLNAEAYLAMRIDDPKDWHTVGELPERNAIFESSVVRFERAKFEEEGFNLEAGHPTRVGRVVTYTETQVEHVRGTATPKTGSDPIAAQAAELERIWGGRNK